MLQLLERLGYYPRFAVWELTLGCNLQCLHCGSRAGKPRDNELTPEEAQDVCHQLVEAGCEKMTLSGGEPTLRKDWDAIARTLVQGGVKVNMISNGFTWTPEHTRRAKDAGMMNVAFSIDGLEAAHDRVRGRVGSFKRAMEAVRLCLEGGMKVAVVSHVNALNKDSLPEFRKYLGDHGVTAWQIQVGNPTGNMGDHQDMVIQPKDILEIVPTVARMRQEQGVMPLVYPADNVGYYGRYERDLRDTGAKVCFWIGCRAGCQVVGIESNGNVKGCLSLPSFPGEKDHYVEGNLREHRLKDIWAKPDAFAYNRSFDVSQLQGFCRTCRFADICRGGCTWTAYARSGSRYDNTLCFYRVAVENQRWDLIPDAAVDQGTDAPVAVPGDPTPMG